MFNFSGRGVQIGATYSIAETKMRGWYLDDILHVMFSKARPYFEDIKKAMEEGRNLAEERYDNLYQNIGKGRLRDVEDSLK